MALVHRSLAERTADAIVREILDGGFGADGSLPPSRALAERYGVSVIVVREALAQLDARGALDRRQGRRVRVTNPDHRPISSVLRFSALRDEVPLQELLQCRSALEVQASRLAAQASGDREAALRPALDGMRRARGAKAFNDNDLAFHLALAELSGNRPIRLILAALREVIREALDLTYGRVRAHEGAAGLRQALEIHERVTSAVLAGDGDAAASAMGAHFDWLLARVDGAAVRLR